jgi:hypothetical protein
MIRGRALVSTGVSVNDAAVALIEVVVCQHCGEKIDVLPNQQPVTYIERETYGPKSFLIIDVDSWLLHRCFAGED